LHSKEQHIGNGKYYCAKLVEQVTKVTYCFKIYLFSCDADFLLYYHSYYLLHYVLPYCQSYQERWLGVKSITIRLKKLDLRTTRLHSCSQAPPLGGRTRDRLSSYRKSPRRTLACRALHRPTPEVDPEILRSMKLVGTIGYARNVTNMRRNQVRYENVKTAEWREREALEKQERQEHGGGSFVPKPYRKVAVKISKMGTDDFDFDRYNRTGFCGLEASLPNSYCNAMVSLPPSTYAAPSRSKITIGFPAANPLLHRVPETAHAQPHLQP
jgi:hypothetical protein